MPLTKLNRGRDPYEDAFAKARDIRLKRTRRPDRPKIVIATSRGDGKTNEKKMTH